MAQLTDKEKAKIFAMYSESEANLVYDNNNLGFLFCGTTGDRKNAVIYRSGEHRWCDWNEIKYELTSLSAISEEHKMELLELIGYVDLQTHTKRMNLNQFDHCFHSVFQNKGEIDYRVYQYLISKGYAVPLWFGVDHWANEKDAIELGIAIDKTN